MKTTLAIISILFFCLRSNSQSNADNDLKTKMLSKIFSIEESIFAEENGAPEEVVLTTARNRYAAIPLNSCFFVNVSDNLAAMAFEIYLSDGKCDYKTMLDSLKYFDFPDNFSYHARVNKNKEKLIQLIYIDLKKEKFIAKPDGFPLEQKFWLPESYGDVGSPDLTIESLKKINNSDFACRLIYSDYISDDTSLKLIILRLHNYPGKTEIIKSETFQAGTMGALAGCGVNIEFNNFRESGYSITAEKHTECDCEDCLESWGIEEGKHIENVELLNWEEI